VNSLKLQKRFERGEYLRGGSERKREYKKKQKFLSPIRDGG